MSGKILTTWLILLRLEHCLLTERNIFENGEMKGGTLRKCPLLERESNIKRKGMPSRMMVKGKKESSVGN